MCLYLPFQQVFAFHRVNARRSFVEIWTGNRVFSTLQQVLLQTFGLHVNNRCVLVELVRRDLNSGQLIKETGTLKQQD